MLTNMLVGLQTSAATMQSRVGNTQKTNLLFDPDVPLLGICQKDVHPAPQIPAQLCPLLLYSQ